MLTESPHVFLYLSRCSTNLLTIDPFSSLADRYVVYFFLKIIGNPRVTFVLAAGLLLLAALGVSPRFGIVPGDMGWWDWTYFGFGVLLFLSLGSSCVLCFFEEEVVLCGKPGVVPFWAEFFGMTAPDVRTRLASPSPETQSSPSATFPKHWPWSKTVPAACRQCGATSDVPYLGAPCAFCGETTVAAPRKPLKHSDLQ